NSNSIIRIPIFPNSDITCKINDEIKIDTVIGTNSVSELLNEYDLSEILRVSIKETKKYLNVINGEVVSKGDLLAKRSTFASLGYYEVEADKAGIVELSKISEGKILILDHKKNIPIYPLANGKITKIIPCEYIEIETSTISFNLANTITANSAYGKFVFISKANIESDDYRGNIVFINSPLTSELYDTIKDNNPLLVIFPSVDASFTIKNKKLKFPYLSFWGYGSSVLLTASYRNLLTKMNSRIANYNKVTQSLDFPLTKNSIPSSTERNSEYTNCIIGEKIVTLNSENAFEEAVITEIFESECRVKYANKKTSDLSFDEILSLC
ncbi:MAG: hypothetical protein WCK31_00780, partial [bacterium]